MITAITNIFMHFRSSKYSEKQEAFVHVVEYMKDHWRDQVLTISDLAEVMKRHCSEPYSNKHLKNLLLERFDGELMICSKYGQSDVIVPYESASAIIQEFRSNQSKNTEDEKLNMIRCVGKLILNDITKAEYDKKVFLDISEVNAEEQLNVLPDSLKILLKSFIPNRSKVDRSLATAMLGQSIMHLIANHYHPPLYVAIGSLVHLRSGSQFLIDILCRLGVSISADQTRKFERCCASQSSIATDD